MLHLYISESWILSSTARRLYGVCALLAICLLGLLIAGPHMLYASGSLGPSASTLLIVKVIAFSGILGTALLSIAMWYFWVGFDRSSWVKRAIWIVPLFFFLAIGPALYYFFVYRKNESVKEYAAGCGKSQKLAGAGLS